MSIINVAEQKSVKGRIAITAIYTLLILGSLTMVFPFAIMATGSISNSFDYDRRSPLPRFLVNRSDRFMRVLCGFFPPSHRGSIRQLRGFFPSLPQGWQSWSQIGDERRESDAWARSVLAEIEDEATLERYRVLARDYGEFAQTCDLRETVLAYDQRYVGPFLRHKYGSLEELNRAWEISIDTFVKVSANEWGGEPIDQRSYVPLVDTRYEDLLEFRQDYREGRYSGFIRHPDATAGFLRPAAFAYIWEEYLSSELGIETYRQLDTLPYPPNPENAPAGLLRLWARFLEETKLPPEHTSLIFNADLQTAFTEILQGQLASLDALNRQMRQWDENWQNIESWEQIALAEELPENHPLYPAWTSLLDASIPILKTRPRPALKDIYAPKWVQFVSRELGIDHQDDSYLLPFPMPDTITAEMHHLWHRFLGERFALRHVTFSVNPKWRADFAAFLEERFRNIEYMNRLMQDEDPDWTAIDSWTAVELTETIPEGPMSRVWMDFVSNEVPIPLWRLRETLPEVGFQKFALDKYRTLSGVNKAYGLSLNDIEELRLPFREAVLVTFHHHEFGFIWSQVSANYRAVFDYLFRRGRAVANTIILVALTILTTLTVNPLAGYALSRFRLRQTEKILVFCLATMAFPTAVAAIPGFLLLRDLGLLNTFAALVLPGAANGMTIFLLKGFFDSLPQDLFEAATIDGAGEWRIFFSVSLPLVKPILAVSALNAFILAYNGWAWAIIVCQDPKIWTMAVWTYQFYQTQTGQPFTVMAAFIVNSLPVLAVFLFCQKIILRGIILPQLK